MQIFKKTAIILMLFYIAASCAQDAAINSSISVCTIGNWVNFNGTPIKAALLDKKKEPVTSDVILSPSEFYIDIRTIKMKTDSGQWFTILENGTFLKKEIVHSVNTTPPMLVPPGFYTAFLIGYGANWQLNCVYTNTNGIITNMTIANTGSTNTYYCLLGTMLSISSITNSEKIQPDTVISLLNISGYPLENDEFKQFYLYFDTMDMIRLLTNSSGNITNIKMTQPTLEIDLK